MSTKEANSHEALNRATSLNESTPTKQLSKPYSTQVGSMRERMMQRVPRWGIVPTIQRQSVAEHSFFVAAMAHRIALVIQWRGSEWDYTTLNRWALLHDSLEAVTGDVPTPIKKHLGELKSAEHHLNTEICREFQTLKEWMGSKDVRAAAIERIVSFADSIEAVCFLHTEHLLGNTAVSAVVREIKQRITNEWHMLPFGRDLDQFDKANIWKEEIEPLINGYSREWPTVA